MNSPIVNIPVFKSLEDIYSGTELEKSIERITSLTESAFIPQPIDWMEENRYMPSEITEDYGMFDRTKAPYLTEPLNRVHPDDPTTHIAIMKSVQSMVTTTFVEGAMGFFTKFKLGSSAYFTSSKTVGKIRSSSALDVLIDNGGLAELLKPISKRTKRKTADTAMYKEFAGGIRWLISSYNSIGDMKSNTFQLIAADEWDEAPAELKGQGDVQGILEGRTMATRIYKMLFVSTPSSMDTSRIYKAFISGDQRKYFVPCPICGDPQILTMKDPTIDYGLTFSMKKDERTGHKVLDNNSIRYICKHCHREFFESSKSEILNKGEWVETWQDTDYAPKSPNHKSYHVDGLMSNALPWQRYCQQFVNTKFGRDILLYKDFVINYKGVPWARVETATDWEKIKQRAEDYALGEVPEGGLILYGGVDVQGDRLEECVVAVGWGKDGGMEFYIVDYKIFFGSPEDPQDQCWQLLHSFNYSQRYKVCGADVGISLVAVDVGYNPNEKNNRKLRDWAGKMHIVHSFVAPRTDKFIAVKGTTVNRSGDMIKEYRLSEQVLKKRYDVATSTIKEMLMGSIDKTSGFNAVHFPKYRVEGGIKTYIGDSFYKQFLSERHQEISPGVMGWKKINERNEVWDTTIYAIAAMYRDNLQMWTQDIWGNYEEELREIANNY